jgi:hypothetical protein
MDLARLLDELTRAAERAGIRVRLETFDPNLSDVRRPRGGLCTLRGKRMILVDDKLPLPEQIATIAEALAGVDLEHLFLPPIVRATIGAYAPVRESERPKPRATHKPPVKVGRDRRPK